MTDGTPTYAPGVPLWVDHSSRDLAASTRFYGQLFGWDAQDLGEEAGHYTMFRSNGKLVAANTPAMDPNAPPAWSTYICTDNAEETTRKAVEAGGQALMGPLQVMDQGSMAVIADPTGAVFCLWQPAAMTGAELVNQPVGFCWNELATRDVESAKRFYPRVFGWGVKANPMPQGGEYIEWQIDGRSIAGGMAMGTMYPPQVPPHWLVYFAVANTDETTKRAQELGGSLMAPAMDTPQGRMAVLADPEGAAFAIIQLQAPSQ